MAKSTPATKRAAAKPAAKKSSPAAPSAKKKVPALADQPGAEDESPEDAAASSGTKRRR